MNPIPAGRGSPLFFAACSQFDKIPGVISPRQVVPHCLGSAALTLLLFAPAADARKSRRQSPPATTGNLARFFHWPMRTTPAG